MNTLFYYHPIFMEHDTGPHPESSKRLEVILSLLKEKHGKDLNLISPRKATMEDAAALHDKEYLETVERLCQKGGGYLDADTPVSPRSFEAALYGLGSLLDGIDALMEKKTFSAFCLVRPPGHHARPGAGMGFCLINHVAAAAAYAIKNHGLERVLIVDFDVHHGNGTQEMFFQDPKVFFLSIHRYPFYPGTGGSDETGEGPGKGKTLNLPIAFGQPPEAFLENFTKALSQTAENHKPQLILVSAGFDAFSEDPVGGLGLFPEHYNALGRIIKKASETHCEGKVLSTLEGGYSLAGLPLCLTAYVEGLEA